MELLEITPGDRVLEIGCGHGLATGLALAAGAEVVALDRSGKMVEACRKRNGGAEALDARGGAFEALSFAEPFDHAFAVNVDFPRQADQWWAKRFREVIKTGGRLVIVLEAPAPQTAERFAREATAALIEVGFRVETLRESGIVALRGAFGDG